MPIEQKSLYELQSISSIPLFLLGCYRYRLQNRQYLNYRHCYSVAKIQQSFGWDDHYRKN